MTKNNALSVYVLTLGLTLVSAQSFSKDAPASAVDPKMQEMMQKWTQYATPGEGHKILQSMVGTWNYTSKFWQSAKSEKPEESKGKSTIKFILGGRFIQHETKGKAMGKPFEGLGITGFDNVKKEYDSIWLDNMGTGLMKSAGTFDPETKTLKDKGTHTCPVTGDTDREFRSEWKIVNAKTMTFTMWGEDVDTDEEFKMMELTYTKAK